MLPFTRKRLVFALVFFCCALSVLAKLGPTGTAGSYAMFGQAITANDKASITTEVDGDIRAYPGNAAQYTAIVNNPWTNVSVTLPFVTATPGIVQIPITVSDLSALNVISYDLNIDFNPAVITPASPAFTQTGTLSSAMSVTPNTGNPGHLIISAFQGVPLGPGSTLLILNFNVIGTSGQSSPLAFADYTDPGQIFHSGFVFNEGKPVPNPITNGSVFLGSCACTPTNTNTPTPTAASRPTWPYRAP